MVHITEDCYYDRDQSSFNQTFSLIRVLVLCGVSLPLSPVPRILCSVNVTVAQLIRLRYTYSLVNLGAVQPSGLASRRSVRVSRLRTLLYFLVVYVVACCLAGSGKVDPLSIHTVRNP